jgi:hypothetical protein
MVSPDPVTPEQAARRQIAHNAIALLGRPVGQAASDGGAGAGGLSSVPPQRRNFALGRRIVAVDDDESDQ